MTPGGLLRAEQMAVVRAAILRLEGEDMVNRVLRVDVDGTLVLENLP